MGSRPRRVAFVEMASIVLLVGLFALMYFLFIRPQQRKLREHRELLSALDVGDEVLTNSGIYGVVSEFDGDTVFLAVADDVELKMSRESIAAIISFDEADTDTDTESESDVDG